MERKKFYGGKCSHCKEPFTDTAISVDSPTSAGTFCSIECQLSDIGKVATKKTDQMELFKK